MLLDLYVQNPKTKRPYINNVKSHAFFITSVGSEIEELYVITIDVTVIFQKFNLAFSISITGLKICLITKDETYFT